MRVSIKCELKTSHPGIVYATVTCADELLISATLDYCLSACHERGWVVENAGEVLYWLHMNVDLRGH